MKLVRPQVILHQDKAPSSCHKTMHAGSQSSTPIMKPLCHKTSASQECCCDTSTLLTQGLNIEPLSHTHTHTHTHTSAAKRAGALTAPAPVGRQFLFIFPLWLAASSAASQRSPGLSKEKSSLLLQPGAAQCNDSHSRHNTPQQSASYVWSSAEVTECVCVCVCVCVCWKSCADLWLGAGAEGSAGVQHRFIIHAFLCIEWWHRGASFLCEKGPSAWMFRRYFHSVVFFFSFSNVE